MNNFLLHTAALFISTLVLFSSCKEEPMPQPEPEPEPIPVIIDSLGYMKGIFVVCEGNFNGNDGSIYYINDTIQIANLYETANNNNQLGDIVQSMTIIDSTAYIAVNNSQKIEVVNAKTFKKIGTIKDLTFPRYVVKVSNDEIAVSNGDGYSNNYVYIINTNTFKKTDSIAVGAGPNKMLVNNNKIYVANMGGWSNDKTISVINTSTLQVIETIEVGDLPADMEFDNNGNLLVLCYGLTTYDQDWNATIVSNSKLVKVNTTTYAVTTIKNFDHQLANFSANGLAYNNGTIYYLDDAVYSISTTNATPTKLIDGYFYGIDINPTTKDIWVTSTSSTNSHKAIQYSPTGTKIKEYVTGFYPNAVVF